MLKLILVYSFFGLIGLSVGQFVQSGLCPDNIPVVANFQFEQFLGTWFEVGRSDHPEQDGDCSTIEFANETTTSIKLEAITRNFYESRNGTVAINNNAYLTVTLDGVSDPIDVGILLTDYSNFALAYRCVNVEPANRNVYIWKLGRQTTFPGELIPALMNTTLNNIFGISIEDLRTIDHSDDACYTLPIIEDGEPIILQGQCNPNVPVVQNFNVANFMGTWREIASYESENAQGTCARADYTLQNGDVLVVNGHVVNETLLTISGSATLIGTDNSGRLNVTLEILPGVFANQELKILATDYQNYAISYTCVNITSDTRRVYSWILGRSRVLSSSTQNVVDQFVNSFIDLNYRYYQNTDQTDAGCFYFPIAQPGVPVVFPGQCDIGIPAQPDFNATAYLGLWHDIESFPSIFQMGTCSNAYYSLGDTVLVRNTQVVNESLAVMEGTAVLASVDGSGKLLVEFPIVGTNETATLEYWILSTDYESYSLVYSCQNRGEDYKEVWSWKLSREKYLSTLAIEAIENVTSTIDVLDQRYYQPMNQSEESCFFYPEPQPGVPVVFPGQCDESIQVVNNFNISLFSGVWHEIQTYPKVQHTGDCINHEYIIGVGDTINLISNRIDDQFLVVTNSTVFTSTDGSAKLTITLTVDGEDIQIPFWILNTDYSDYALAYSCENINSDFRAVYSWKLSRSKELSDNAHTSINNTISTIRVLDNVYYEDVDQTDEACFYLPELAPGEPIVLFGQCDTNISVVANFNASAYSGRWRLIESYPTEFQNGTCNDATYTILENGVVDVFNTQVINETLDTIRGSAVLASDDGSAKLLVTFPGTDVPSDYWVLRTDYESYALVYSCININPEQRRVWSWKLSRTTQLTPAANNAMNEVIASINVLNNRYYEEVDNTDPGCFYFPEPDGRPVTFRGQCDQNINVVTDFDIPAYMNLWHDIESYPSEFQNGSCNNAFYTLGDEGVLVRNTQVINQTLDVMNGIAVPATNDSSAKLLVSFPIAGTNLTTSTDYWVLATDYTSYAIVYTCTNIDEENRRVWSWKLSRTKQLTENATIAINNVISTIPVLDQRYYVPKGQNEEDCFFFPEPVPGEPVVFPGRCDNTIQAVPNFNLTQFQGVWHEIQAYPKLQQPGHCVNHDYTVGNDGISFNLQSSGVTDQILTISSSSVSFASTDGSGRLNINITVNGTEITIPFWILSTDYENYALAYSCVPSSDDFRSVFSWKLSRTRELSANSNTAINNAILPIQVLDNVYYEDIDQSDEACFFLPDLAPGEPVVFTGQCDQNITVVQNFDPVAYGGRWRLIETYAAEFQGGECIDATYTLTVNGTVDVYNTQVINETLDTINGTAVLATTDGSGKLLVTFPDSGPPSEYWILDTDYLSYALVYSCVNINPEQRRVYSWKLSRNRELTPAANTAINQVVDRINVLNDRYYQSINHSDTSCFYFPEANGTPVVFRGQCDESIPVVANFSVADYLGLWHNIESYPSVFQEGTCHNADYSLGDEVVLVHNTQVINQTLFTMDGVAVLASDDNSAKLLVSFPIAGTNQTTNTSYWVLATDYNSFSLVYTCENLDDEYIQVWSWKLSRSKQLAADAVPIINNVTDTIQVLDQRYYQDNDQSEPGCFFFPDPEPGVPVLFPGQCDNTIQAVPNFNLTRFEGIWHEIQAYPKLQQPGHCVNHDYTLENDGISFNLQSSGVTDQTLTVTASSVSINSTDGSGRLSINVTANGTTITIPFWILSTDYEDYALAYSCENYNSDFRTVYSWKLSRTKELSDNASTSINNAIAPIQVLENRYYEDIDQSDEACFFLPDLAPGDPVIFVGQCDPNITVVQNFNATAYGGRWRLIESYATEFQDGECIDATYTLSGSGTVDVFNTQVINETLDTINGSAVLATDDGSAKLLVTFPNAPVPSDYWVLSTDYDSYALVYSCININNNQRRVRSWKLSRSRELTAAANNAINEVINRVNVLENRYYGSVSHTDASCFYFPTPDGRPVTFRGQCDDNITVVTNFQANLYTGRWFDIESYPQTFQNGTCATAYYTLTDTGIDVTNTQVVAERLDTINGTAVPATNDGSAKFYVSFPIAGTNEITTTPYWVLNTDYENFAFVYSCVNIDEEYRRVSSWKLSRQQSLSPASELAINAVIDTVQVLDQQYYTETGHTENDCFFYPENYGGPVILDGQCMDQNVVENFNLNAFAGTWYEISRFPSELQTGECAVADFVLYQNSFNITTSIVNNERINTLSGIAALSNDNRGILNITFNDGTLLTTYVLDTDYTNFALLFGCADITNSTKQIFSWKLSKSPDGLSQTANERINEIVNSNIDLFEDYYEETDQSNDGCFHYPEFDVLPDEIILTGPCDQSIRGKANFNATAYLGTWFEIERYPQPFQFGQCSRAQYSSSTDGVHVLNTQVINQTLDTQIGSAVVASTDGSGLLNVTFIVNGVENQANYYILDTDYDTFALVYSCRNLDNNRRQVASWKLSRSRSLSNQANNIINGIISSTQGLIQDYYVQTSQSDEDCFYIPEFNPDQALVFRGQCEDISGVQNFDINRYLGWWHEIERYPSDGNVGECINSQFSSSGNQILVVDTGVFDLAAEVNSSTVTVTNNGRLRRTYTNGQVVDMWVLATDYDTYSLLYSCEDIEREDGSYRRVWSAKHSKTRSLTPEAQNNMASVIANNQVLYPEFYLDVNQSDAACFHYPSEIGQQVILRGQCDANIGVFQNFDPGQYTGTWYQIERYPQLWERGTCTGARYSLDEGTGVVTVLNWEVVDGVLDTIEGTATIISTDGSARLEVVLPARDVNGEYINGTVTMNLYVLTTDYISYSLVYSCTNINPHERSIGAWKLSRSRTMPSAGTTAINNVIVSREELHQPFFNEVEHHDECEEPSSSFLVKSSIIVLLICAVLQLLL